MISSMNKQMKVCPEVQTSDPERGRAPTKHFLDILSRTRDAGLSILFHNDDGYYFMYYPHELTQDNVKERHSSEIQDYHKDKLQLEPGMKVRVKWSKSIRIAKATVHAVGEKHAVLIALVSRPESEQKAKKAKKLNKLPRRRGKILEEDRAEQERSKRAALVKETINPGQERTSALSSDIDGERLACDKEQEERSRRSALVKRRTKLSKDSTSTLSSDDNTDRIECEREQEEKSKRSAVVERRTKLSGDSTSTLSSDNNADRIECEKGQVEKSKQSAGVKRRTKRRNDKASILSSDQEADRKIREKEKESARSTTLTVLERFASQNFPVVSPSRASQSPVTEAVLPKTGITESDANDDDQQYPFDHYENSDNRPDAEDFTENEYLPREDSDQDVAATDKIITLRKALPASSKYPSTAGKEVDEEKVDHWKRSRDMYKEKFLEYDKKLKEIDQVRKIKPKVKVPSHKWQFERGSAADRNIFQRLGNKHSNIWVNKEHLLNLQQTTKSMSLYATKLMFKVLLSRQELINVAPKKMEGVGSVKMFGAKNFADFHEHVRKFREGKLPAGGKWGDQPLSEQELKRKFVSNFNTRIKSIQNICETQRQELSD